MSPRRGANESENPMPSTYSSRQSVQTPTMKHGKVGLDLGSSTLAYHESVLDIALGDSNTRLDVSPIIGDACEALMHVAS